MAYPIEADHLEFVRSIVRTACKWLPPHIEREELVGVGCIGLLDAAEKYDATKNVTFNHYAHIRIRGAIIDHLRKFSRGPDRQFSMRRKLECAYRNVEQRISGKATEEQVADELGMTIARFEAFRDRTRLSVISLDAPINGTEIKTLADSVAAQTDTPFDSLTRQEQRRTIDELISRLHEQERRVIHLYYVENRNMREIAEMLNLTDGRICQIRGSALRRLHRMSRRETCAA